METYSLIIHGGSWSYNTDDPIEQAHLREQEKSLGRIIREGWEFLSSGMPALEVVEKTVNLLEMDPVFNAGIGAAIGIDGQIELDASIMDGKTLECGAVAGLIQIPNAISVARAVMKNTRHVLLAGEGANVFAKTQGFTILPREQFYTDYQKYRLRKMKEKQKLQRESHGTVGVVAKDMSGSLAAGTSTGGTAGKLLGRVGDNPLIGAGTYADNAVGAAVATGFGEQIIKIGLTRLAIDMVDFKEYSAQKACEEVIARLATIPIGLGGIILIDRNGEIGAFGNEDLPRAYMSSRMEKPVVQVKFH